MGEVSITILKTWPRHAVLLLSGVQSITVTPSWVSGSSDPPGKHDACLVSCPGGTAVKIARNLVFNKQLEEGEIVQGASGSAAPSGFLMA